MFNSNTWPHSSSVRDIAFKIWITLNSTFAVNQGQLQWCIWAVCTYNFLLVPNSNHICISHCFCVIAAWKMFHLLPLGKNLGSPPPHTHTHTLPPFALTLIFFSQNQVIFSCVRERRLPPKMKLIGTMYNPFWDILVHRWTNRHTHRGAL